jgi:hypothetical protein
MLTDFVRYGEWEISDAQGVALDFLTVPVDDLDLVIKYS